MPDAITDVLLKQGAIGVLALIAVFVSWKLAMKVDTLQERRVADVEKITNAVSAITIATDRNTEAIERLTERLGR